MSIRAGIVLTLSVILASCSVNSKIRKELSDAQQEREDFRGLVIYDLTKDKELLNYNGNKYFIPASTVKLFTFYTAYRTLPDSVSSLDYLLRGDSLMIRGTADPLVLEDQQDEVVAFLKERKENLFLVDKKIEDSKYGPGWSWDDYGSSYMAERSLFPLYGNLLTASYSDSLEVSPAFFREAVTRNGPAAGQDVSSKMGRDSEANRFYISVPKNGTKRSIPFITSNQLAADLLGEAIGRRVTLVPDEFDSDFSPLLTRPYDSLYTRMLVESDNFIAEQLMLQVGHKVKDTYMVRAAIDFALDSLINGIPQKPRWVDGSGLSRYNLFTPESVVFLLRKMHREIPEDQLLGFLAQGGVSGTLEDHYKGPTGEPYVFAKSGTLSNNYCLSGYLKTKKGRLLAFSFIDNHYLGSSNDKKKELESYLLRLWDGN